MAPTIYDHEEVFAQYVKSTTEKETFARRFAERFGERSRPASLVDLGCNDGELTLRYLSAIEGALPAGSRVVCVEPNHRSLEVLRARTVPLKWRFDLIEQTLEQFLEESRDPFDWAIASHSLYWCASMRATLEKLLARARKVALVLREKDALCEIEERFRPRATGEHRPIYTSDDIAAALTALGAPFEREVFATEVEVPPFEDPRFALLVAFLIDVPPALLRPDLLGDVRDFLEPFGSRFRHSVSFFWAGR